MWSRDVAQDACRPSIFWPSGSFCLLKEKLFQEELVIERRQILGGFAPKVALIKPAEEMCLWCFRR